MSSTISFQRQGRSTSGSLKSLIFLLLFINVLLVGCGSNSAQPDSQSSSLSGHSSDSSSTASSAGRSSDSFSVSSSVSSSATVPPDNEHGLTGFYVSGDTLYDHTDHAFVMRGVNYPYAWFRGSENTEQKFKDIATTGANTIRVVLTNGEQWRPRVSADEVANIIEWAKANQMVAMLEVHDATGWPQQESAAHPDTAVDYWLSEDIKAVIEGEEQFVLINIANEPLGNFDTPEEDYRQWVDFHIGAIERLRDAGLSHTLVVDAPNWGQDWTNTMRDSDGAQRIFNADPVANVVFSVHMYDVYAKPETVNAYFSSFDDKALPLIVGEFAADHGSDRNVDQQAIMMGAEAHGFGYLGWSWSGNGGGLGSLDIVEDFDLNQVSEWGESLLNSDYGIRATSEVCRCFLTD